MVTNTTNNSNTHSLYKFSIEIIPKRFAMASILAKENIIPAIKPTMETIYVLECFDKCLRRCGMACKIFTGKNLKCDYISLFVRAIFCLRPFVLRKFINKKITMATMAKGRI